MFGFRRKPEEYHIMPAGDGDWQDLARIHGESFRDAWSDGELERLAGSKGMKVWLARPHGKGGAAPHGFAIVRCAADEAEIVTIASASRHRRRGASRALLRHIIRELQNDRIERLFLEVSQSNEAAIGLYRSLGFHQAGLRRAYYAQGSKGDTGDALVMQLDLR